MSTPEGALPSPEDEARGLMRELDTAYEGVKTAVDAYTTVQDRVEAFINKHELIPELEREGLEEPFNDLYRLWMQMPDGSELGSVARYRRY